MNKLKLFSFSLILISCFSCNKKKSNIQDKDTLHADILHSIAYNVCTASYEELYNRALILENTIQTLQTNPTESNLIVCQTAWRNVRHTWENTESWLFGPISANSIDPRIDTWPVDFNEIDSVLNLGIPLSENFIDNLEDALKGFHPTEYYLWGANGNKMAAQITPRQFEYLIALTHNLSKLTKEVRDSWKDSFANEVATAGNGSATYSTKQKAFVEIINAMAEICEEVANGKMKDPFINQDASLEESPYSNNSMSDFTQNIQGVLMIYQGDFNGNHLGIEDLVRTHNTSLDLEIKNAHAEAIAALNAINIPFGQAIFSQQMQIQKAMDKINILAETLENKLKPFILQYVQ